MALDVKHTTQAAGTDAGNGEIRKAQWNENHTMTAVDGRLLGTSGSTTVGEITPGTSLTLNAGTLSVTFGSTAEILAGTVSDKALSPAGVRAAHAWVDVASAATVTLDLATGINFRVGTSASTYDTLGASLTLANPTNKAGGLSGSIRLKQPAAGGPYTITYGTDWKAVGGTAIALSTTASAIDYIDWQIAPGGTLINYTVRKACGG